MLNYGLAGRVVVVTGGASGIGLASVLALARDGSVVDVREAATLAAELGPAWGLIASAGIAGAGKAEDLTLEEWRNISRISAPNACSTPASTARNRRSAR